MDARTQHLLNITRRHFLRTGSLGLGGLALSLLSGDTASAQQPNLNPLAPRRPHFAPKAKRVVYLHMAGSPPHLDLFDYKPELVRRNAEPCPESFLRGRRFAFTSGVPRLLGTPQRFARHGQSAQWMSEAVQHLPT